MQVEGIIHVVDDDAAMRASLHMLLSSAGFEVVAYASGMELLDGLDRAPSATPCCLVTDVHMPGMGGLELQERLSGGRHSMPVVVITGQGDVPGAVRALKAGAVDFIEKPFDPEVLLSCVREALRRDRQLRSTAARTDAARPRHSGHGDTSGTAQSTSDRTVRYAKRSAKLAACGEPDRAASVMKRRSRTSAHLGALQNWPPLS